MLFRWDQGKIMKLNLSSHISVAEQIIDGSITINSIDEFKSILKIFPNDPALQKAFSNLLNKEKRIEEAAKSSPKSEKKVRGKRKPKKEAVTITNDEPQEPEMTAMQIAWQEALDRAKSRKDEGQKGKRQKAGTSNEQEELLSRTLEDRLPTGG